MDASTPSQPLLAHFDGPETAVENELVRGDSSRPVRGVGWVLKWAGVVGMLVVSTSFLIEFGYRLAAEQTLARAARAGLREATLPHATSESVQRTVQHRLSGLSLSPGELLISLQQNGTPIRGPIRLRDGDRLSLLLTAPSRAALPNWLSASFSLSGDERLKTTVERQLPDRHLPPSTRDAG